MTSPPREADATPAADPTATTASPDRFEDPTVTTPHPAPPAETATATREPGGSPRVRDLLARMTLAEKLSQIVGFWDKGDGEAVAPLQGEFGGATGLEEAARHGLGHLTRPYGTRPVDPVERAAWLWRWQRTLVTETRLGIPALVHEESLTGLAAWTAATYPTPLAWGASFDTALVEEMAALTGASMRTLGIHQGLAPVLDVIRDPRWGRVEECISEDPYLVGTIGSSYVRGLQSAGVHATLKHFVGYSASQSGRNFAPVHAGPARAGRRAAPAVRDGGPRRRCPVGDALVRRDRRPAGGGRPGPAHRSAARTLGFRRHGRRRLLRRRLPPPPAPRRGRPRRGRGPGAGRRCRHRAALR